MDSKNKKYNLRSKNNKKSSKDKDELLKCNESSDSDTDYISNDESDSDNEEMDLNEYHKFLHKMFPSKHLENKIKQHDKLFSKKIKKSLNSPKQSINDNKITNKTDKVENIHIPIKNDSSNKCNDKSYDKEIYTEEDEEEDEEKNSVEDEEDEDSMEDEEDEEDETAIKNMLKEKMNFNIVFTLGDKNIYNEDEDEYEDEEDEYEDEDEEDEEDEYEDEDEEDENKNEDKEDDDEEITKTLKNTTETTKDIDDDSLKQLMNFMNTNTKSKNITLFNKLNGIVQQEQKKQNAKKKKKERKEKMSNVKKLRKLLREKNVMNDTSYFKSIEISEQKHILTELERILKHTNISKPYRIALIESDIPIKFKANALRKINSLTYMDPGSGEYYKIKQWVDTFMHLPFGIYRNLDITIEDGIDKCSDFMKQSKQILDDAVYGLNDAKAQILQMMGQWISNPNSVGTAIAIKGPMGTGKTTLVKEGISKILNRPFAFLALGGATDSAYMEGHSYTYEGSRWGQIVEILKQSKCMNPVIYFDELDKVSETPKGEEIIGILTHLTDVTQNSQFHDKYFADIDFDLSKCLFIFSYNDESKVNQILLDRMYRIQTNGYDKKQKIIIANKYLIPKIEQNVNFDKEQIIFTEETLGDLIDNYTEKEKGVRNLKRCLEIVFTKLNLFRLMKSDTKLFDDQKVFEIKYPFTVTADVIQQLLKKKETEQWMHSLYT